jgi:hypothetical protein
MAAWKIQRQGPVVAQILVTSGAPIAGSWMPRTPFPAPQSFLPRDSNINTSLPSESTPARLGATQGRQRWCLGSRRTRTISLGMSAGACFTSTVADRRSCWPVRKYPRSPPGDLPIGHVAGTPVPWSAGSPTSDCTKPTRSQLDLRARALSPWYMARTWPT